MEFFDIYNSKWVVIRAQEDNEEVVRKKGSVYLAMSESVWNKFAEFYAATWSIFQSGNTALCIWKVYTLSWNA